MPFLEWITRIFKRNGTAAAGTFGSLGALGTRSEHLAARYARKHLRMKILNRNVRCPGGELDLIALDGQDIVFIEVRSLSSEEFTRPEDTVRYHKRRFVARSARWFYRSRRLQCFHPRIDIIAIVWPEDSDPTIRHHRNAFPFSFQ